MFLPELPELKTSLPAFEEALNALRDKTAEEDPAKGAPRRFAKQPPAKENLA